MRNVFRKILQILDGTPAAYGQQRTRGQALVEMALITPVLIVMITALVEMGWAANRYLTLMEATRAGARRGTVLQDTMSPLQWDNEASHVPDALLPLLPATGLTLSEVTSDTDFRMAIAGDVATVDRVRTKRNNYRQCPTNVDFLGFYNDLVCVAITSLSPLGLNNVDRWTDDDPPQPRRAVDDIVVSVFAIEVVKTQYMTAFYGGNPAVMPLQHLNTGAADVDQIQQAVVVGRYPTNANECEVGVASGTGDPVNNPTVFQLRDPFDLDDDDLRALNPLLGANLPLFDEDPLPAALYTPKNFNEIPGYDPFDAGNPEQHVGFSWFGNNRIPDTYCVGSEWAIQDIEEEINLPSFNLVDTSDPANEEELRGGVPSSALVLLEMHYEHELLLQFPAFAPLYDILGPRTTFYVWAAFPVPTAEPFIFFVEDGSGLPETVTDPRDGVTVWP